MTVKFAIRFTLTLLLFTYKAAFGFDAQTAQQVQPLVGYKTVGNQLSLKSEKKVKYISLVRIAMQPRFVSQAEKR